MARILLLEDNADMLIALADVLEFHQHVVVIGYNGREGLRLLSEGLEVDLIISDITMPLMDGLSFLGAVRQNTRWSQIPFTMMSGHTGDKDKVINAGADAFINKPFQIDELQALLSRFLHV